MKEQMVKHTPLPWSLKVFDDGAFILTEGDDTDETENMILASRNPAPDNRTAESNANAYLFKAAPMLLEEIKKARMSGSNIDRESIDAAIQAAEGEAIE